jgi:hypothetical protein
LLIVAVVVVRWIVCEEEAVVVVVMRTVWWRWLVSLVLYSRVRSVIVCVMLLWQCVVAEGGGRGLVPEECNQEESAQTAPSATVYPQSVIEC